MSEIIVSFCVPVYNNAEAAVRIVNDLLDTKDARFEIVVSDDASSDETEKLLREIQDERFRYFRNAKNLGAHKNWEHSLELGRGRWLYLVMGRDRMHGENITALIERLNYADENGITYLKDRGRKREGVKVYEGIEAMSEFVTYNHPTGCIFKADLFREIPGRTRYFEISDMYPEIYVVRDLLLKGKGAQIHSGVAFGGFVTDKSAAKSNVERGGDIRETYFAPLRRTKQFFEHIDMVMTLKEFTSEELDKFFENKYRSLLEHVSYRWRIWCGDAVQMSHYGQPVTKISLAEMIRNITQAFKDTKSHLEENGMFTPTRKEIMKKITARSAFHLTVKTIIRAIIEPLGIWKILHFFRNY